MSTLLDEFAAAANRAYEVRGWMTDQGVPFDTSGPARIGVDRIVPEVGGAFFPDPGGRPAWLFGEGYADQDGWHVLHDIVAVLIDDPAVIWRRRGLEPMLGRHNLPPARCNRIPVQAHADPVQWYLAGCSGFVVLDWSADLMPLLRGSEIYSDDQTTAARIKKKTDSEILREALPIRVGLRSKKRAA